MNLSSCNDVNIYRDDIPSQFAVLAKMSGTVCWDIETSGLDWSADRIATCQLCIPRANVAAIVRIGNAIPELLCSILADDSINKIFHYALFDLRFMCHQWNTSCSNVTCTKVASKLLHPSDKKSQTLESLLKRYVGVTKDKSLRFSDWFSHDLSATQIEYALNDVRYLDRILVAMQTEIKSKGLLDLAEHCFAHIPTRVTLEISGYGDIYTY